MLHSNSFKLVHRKQRLMGDFSDILVSIVYQYLAMNNKVRTAENYFDKEPWYFHKNLCIMIKSKVAIC